MDLYNVVLFAHIAGATVLLSYGFVSPLLMHRIGTTATVTSLREWVDATYRYTKLGPPAAVLVLLSGVYMALTQFSFRTGWVAVSLVLFVIAGGIAGGVLDPHLAKLRDGAHAAPDGPVPAELRAIAADPKPANLESLMTGFDVAILFMMTNKPGWVGALVATAVGLVVGGALIAYRSRSTSSSPAVTA